MRVYKGAWTAPLRVANEVRVGLEKGVLLVVTDLSSAFNTVDHSVLLLSLLQKRFGVSDTVLKWLTCGSPSASDPRAKNTGQRATKGTVLTSQSLSPWCDCRRLGSTWASWRWQGITSEIRSDAGPY